MLDEKSLPCSTNFGFLILLFSVVMQAEEFSENNTLGDILVAFEVGQMVSKIADEGFFSR